MIRIAGSAAEQFGTVLRVRRAGDFVLRESRYPGSLSTPLHAHPNPYFCVVLGGVVHERSRSDERTYGAGTVHYHPAEHPHAAHFGPQGARCLSIAGDATLPSRFATLLRGVDPGPLEHRALTLAAHCYEEFLQDDTASSLALEALSLEMIASLLRRPRLGGEAVASPRPRWLSEVRDYLQAYFAAPIPLSTLSRLAGIHEVHLVRTFRRSFGCTPGAYVRRLRIEAACNALVHSDVPIAAIALDVGFSSQAHLSRVFRLHIGMPPGAYRRQGSARTKTLKA